MKLQTARNILLSSYSFISNASTIINAIDGKNDASSSDALFARKLLSSKAVGNDITLYTGLPDLNNWNEVVAFCADQGLLLPTLAQICPDGPLKPPVGGSIEGDQWVAIGDVPNSWTHVGIKDLRLCQSHQDYYKSLPGWGEDNIKTSYESNYAYCVETPKPTSAPTSEPTSDPTSQPTLSPTTFIEGIEGIAKGGCKNRIDFSSAFFASDSGAACDTCTFCDESTTNSVFNPHIENVCMDCSKADDACNTLQVVTKFDSSWLMNVLSLTSSGMGVETDPAKVIMKGSNDLSDWVELYNSPLVFTERKKPEEFPFTNDKMMFKYYSLGFERKESSSKMHVGNYGLVEAYTKSCAIQLFEGSSGNLISPSKNE